MHAVEEGDEVPYVVICKTVRLLKEQNVRRPIRARAKAEAPKREQATNNVRRLCGAGVVYSEIDDPTGLSRDCQRSRHAEPLG